MGEEKKKNRLRDDRDRLNSKTRSGDGKTWEVGGVEKNAERERLGGAWRGYLRLCKLSKYAGYGVAW